MIANNIEINIPQHEAEKRLSDGFYVKINKGWTATVRCLADLVHALEGDGHQLDMSVFGTIVKESSDPDAGNFYYYLLKIIEAYRGMPTFNKNKHTFIELDEDRHTISVKTKEGKLVTFAFMEYADCIDVCVHNSGHPPLRNGSDKKVPQFDIIGFNLGGTPVKRTKVTVATIMLNKEK